MARIPETIGPIDLLVNDASIAPRVRADILEASEENFDELIETNLEGPYLLTHAVARQMAARQSGRIVFITSISAFTASLNRADYCIFKAVRAIANGLLDYLLNVDGGFHLRDR